MKIRKKPIVVDGWLIVDLLDAASNDWDGLPKPVSDAYESGGWAFCPTELHIPTSEGTMVGNRNDWLIMGVAGEFYPCKPDVFVLTYEMVE